MNGFEDREQAFENKFGYDEETEFKISSRMARLFGRWAAQQMGMEDKEVDTYADSAVDADMKRNGEADLLDKIEKDFKAKNISISRHRMERELENCRAKAHDEIIGKSA
jgi:hypothetical protein